MSLRTVFRKIGNAEELIRISRTSPERAKKLLEEVLRANETANREWYEAIFGELRKRNSFIDCIMSGEEGRVETSWATISDYADYPKKRTPPTIEELLGIIAQDGRMNYMISPVKSSVIFYFPEHEGILLEQRTFEPGSYITTNEGLTVKMAYVERVERGKENPIGQSALKSEGLAVGRLGYWARSRIETSKADIGFLSKPAEQRLIVEGYIPRVIIEKHPKIGYVYLTPLHMAELLASGGLPMDRPREGQVRVYRTRIEVPNIAGDFIVDSFIAYLNDGRVNGFPLVLRFNAYRPWAGYMPQHGEPKIRK